MYICPPLSLSLDKIFYTFRVPEDPYKCFEHDNPPVDTSATFYDYCKDNHGNMFPPARRPEDPVQLKSCCDCLE